MLNPNRGGGGGGGWPLPALQPSTYDSWQLNPKLNVSVVPEWDSKDEMVIDYIVFMAYLASFSDKMRKDIAQMAPSKFTDRARRWWTTLPSLLHVEYSQDWDHLLDAIRRHFLTKTWLTERRREFDAMTFRQTGHRSEEPIDFFQRRILHHSFIYADSVDGPEAVDHITFNQPDGSRISPIARTSTLFRTSPNATKSPLSRSGTRPATSKRTRRKLARK